MTIKLKYVPYVLLLVQLVMAQPDMIVKLAIVHNLELFKVHNVNANRAIIKLM